VSLLDHLDGARQMLAHPQPCHDNRQPPPCKSADCDFVLDVAQLSPASASGAQDAHIEQLLEQHVLLLPAEGIGGVEVGDLVGELAQRTAQLVVFAVVVAALDGIAAHNEGLAVVVVGLVCVEVDLAEQLLLMMLEFARHIGSAGCVLWIMGLECWLLPRLRRWDGSQKVEAAICASAVSVSAAVIAAGNRMAGVP
jgi:hypothetical protein